MDVRIVPVPLRGKIKVPASKSELHRLLICAAFSDRPVLIYAAPGYLSDDIQATIGCLESLGARIGTAEKAIAVIPAEGRKGKAVLECHESGSTLRMLLPAAAAVCGSLEVSGTGSLPGRPVEDLLKVMKEHGTSFTRHTVPFKTEGILKGGRFTVRGDITSQYLSGLLLAAPLMDGGAEIKLSSPLVSAGYAELTIDVMRRFGMEVSAEGSTWSCRQGGYVSPDRERAGGDWSAAAAFMAMAAAGKGCDITLEGLDSGSLQPDRKMLDILRDAGADIDTGTDSVRVRSSQLKAFSADASEVPDLIPVLSAMACAAEGKSVFRGCGRLRYKESDRMAVMAGILSEMGASVSSDGDTLMVETAQDARSCGADPRGDHRIVMAAAAAAYAFSVPVTVRNAEAVTKSYPGLFRDLRSLGGEADVI